MSTVEMNTEDTSFKNTIGYDDVDLSEYSDEELRALGIDPSEVEGRGNSEEEEEEEPDTEEDEEEDETPEEEEDSEEDEEEDEEDTEEDTEEDEKEEKVDRRKEPRIPKSRFDEAVQKEREKYIRAEERSKLLEERIEQLLALQEKVTGKEVETPPEFDFIAAEEKYAQLLIEGELKDAASLRVQINAEKDKWVESLVKQVREETLKETESKAKSLSEAEKKQLVIEQAFIDYPFLDSEHDEFNKDLVEEVNALASGLQGQGKSPAEALQKAIDRLVKPLKKEEKKKEPPKKNIRGKKEKIKRMGQQPPDIKSSGKVKDKAADDFDWESMTQAEFEKLMNESPELVKEAMRKNYAI